MHHWRLCRLALGTVVCWGDPEDGAEPCFFFFFCLVFLLYVCYFLLIFSSVFVWCFIVCLLSLREFWHPNTSGGTKWCVLKGFKYFVRCLDVWGFYMGRFFGSLLMSLRLFCFFLQFPMSAE